MKLMTNEIARRIPPLGAQEKVADPIVHVKFFDQTGSWTWYATEYDPATGRMFGWVRGLEDELGYFDLNELSQVKGRFGLGIERDLHFGPTPLSKIMSGEVR